MSYLKRSATALLISLAGLSCFAATASAGVADYPTTSGFSIPNNTGINGIPSQVFVPPGRTAVQKVELTNIAPSFGGGGGTDLELRLQSPNGTELTLFNTGCATWPNTSSFSMNDEAANLAGSAGFCATQLPTGTGKPNNLDGKTFAIYNGSPSAGVWTMVVRDVGLVGTLGTWKGWNLRITHAPPVLTASAAKQVLAKTQALRAKCDADCSIAIGGDSKAQTVSLSANSQATLAISLKKKVVKTVTAAGKATAKVKLTATDLTGGTATKTVKIKLRA